MRRFGTPVLISLSLLAASTAVAGPADILRLAGGHLGVNAVAISANQTVLATCSATDNSAKLWRGSDGVMLRTCAAHEAGINSSAISPDGKMLATGGDVNFGSGDIQVKLWDIATAKVIRTFESEMQSTYSVTFSPDGTMLAAGQGSDVRVWRVADGMVLHTLTGHGFTVFGVAWSPDNSMIASGSGDRTVKLWNASTGALIRTLPEHANFVSAVVFSPDGQTVVSASWDQSARISLVSTGATVRTLTGSADALYTVAYAPDASLIATAGGDLTIRLYNPVSGALVRSFSDPGIGGAINSVAFAGDSKSLWSGSYDSHARRWHVADGSLELTVGHHTGTINTLSYSPDGTRLATGSSDMTGHIWDAASAQDLHALVGHFDVVNAVAWSEDMSQVATAAGSPPPDTRDTTIRVWNPATGALIRTLSGHRDGSTGIDYTPDNQLLISGGRDRQLKFWRKSDGVVLKKVNLPSSISTLRVSPSGAVLAVASGTEIRTFNVSTAGFIRAIPVGSQVVSLSWSSDDSTVAAALSAYGNNVQIWDTRHGTLVRTLPGDPFGFEQAVAYSPDGSVLYTSSGYTYSLQAWRVSDGALLATYDEEGGWGQFPTMSIDVAPDGHQFAYGRNDATLVVARNPFLLAVDPAGAAGGSLGLAIAPNPLSGPARVTFRLSQASRVQVEVLDVTGREVRELAAGTLAAGPHTFAWDRNDNAAHAVEPGIYFIDLRGDGGLSERRKVAVLR